MLADPYLLLQCCSMCLQSDFTFKSIAFVGIDQRHLMSGCVYCVSDICCSDPEQETNFLGFPVLLKRLQQLKGQSALRNSSESAIMFLTHLQV